MEEKNEKSKKGLIITLVVVIILLLGACGYLLYDKLNTKDNNEVKPTPSATPTNTPSPSPSVSNVSSYNVCKYDVDYSGYDLSNFVSKNAINGPSADDYFYSLGDISTLNKGGCSVASAYINADKRSVSFVVNDINLDIFNTLNIKANSNMYTVSGFDKNVDKVYVAGFGQTWGGETIFYIMDDGSVYYTPLFYVLKNNVNNETNLIEKLSIASEVVRITNANGSCPYCMEDSSSVIGLKSDGTFYDLSSMIYNSINYNKYYIN